ncbi:MAG: hypothetical protein KGQ41_03870 [Alphaproteobacteria bacterium]|nr:hypothetical protein [Alphaproteobacteria bacterium]
MHGTFVDLARGSFSLLRQRLDDADTLLMNLSDPHLGHVGPQYLQAIHQSGVVETEAQDYQICDNVYVPFEWPNGFVNAISYKSHRFSPVAFFMSRIHETLHAIAWANNPVLHASIFNNNTPVILCPRDWATLFEMTEADVSAKTAWLGYMASHHDYAFERDTGALPVSVTAYRDVLMLEGCPKKALTVCAQTAMQKNWGVDNRDGRAFSFAEFYHWLALRDYENMLAAYERQGIKPVVVRLSDRDRESLGNSFGPNPFIAGTYKNAGFKWQEEDRIQALNARLGIWDESALPCFEDRLASMGITPAQMLANSKGGQQMGIVPAMALNTQQLIQHPTHSYA